MRTPRKRLTQTQRRRIDAARCAEEYCYEKFQRMAYEMSYWRIVQQTPGKPHGRRLRVINIEYAPGLGTRVTVR